MAWTINRQGCMIELVPDGSTDFSWEIYFPDQPEGIRILSIQVWFKAANDEIEIRTHSATGPRILKYTTTTGESIAKVFYGGLLKPYIVDSEQVSEGPAAHADTEWIITIQTE